MKDFYLLIAGTRTFGDYAMFKAECDKIVEGLSGYRIHVVEGGARGADAMARRYAEENGFEVHEFKAEWEVHGKGAGYIRNAKMHEFIAQFDDRLCLCFWNGTSKGTAHNFELARRYKTPLKKIIY